MMSSHENILIQVSVVLASFSVTVAGVSLPPYDAMELEHAPMEVMRGTAVCDHATLCNWIAISSL